MVKVGKASRNYVEGRTGKKNRRTRLIGPENIEGCGLKGLGVFQSIDRRAGKKRRGEK